MENSPLKEIPAEIRNRISELVLTRSEPILLQTTVPFDHDYFGWQDEDVRVIIIEDDATMNTFTQRALSRTCKQLHKETIGLFFAVNEFKMKLDGHGTLGPPAPPRALAGKLSIWLRPISRGITFLTSDRTTQVRAFHVVQELETPGYHTATPQTLLTVARKTTQLLRPRITEVVFFMVKVPYIKEGPHCLRWESHEVPLDMNKLEESCRKGAESLQGLLDGGVVYQESFSGVYHVMKVLREMADMVKQNERWYVLLTTDICGATTVTDIILSGGSRWVHMHSGNDLSVGWERRVAGAMRWA
jgi:hypothetical protein